MPQRSDAEWAAFVDKFFEPLTHHGMWEPMAAAFCRTLRAEMLAEAIAFAEDKATDMEPRNMEMANGMWALTDAMRDIKP